MNKKEKGFTLIEIMVIILIVVLISSVSFVAINNARIRTRNAIIKSSLKQIQGIAETIYNPETGYRELYDMNENSHKSIVQIKNKINEMGMGRNFALWFSCESVNPNIKENCDIYSSQYCAYVFLVAEENKIFCVDSKGFSGVVDVSSDDIHCMIRESSEDSCSYR